MACKMHKITEMSFFNFQDLLENIFIREIRKDPTSSYQKLATDFNSKTQAVRISKCLAKLKYSINLHFGECIVIQLIESKNNETITKKTLLGWLCHA
ncbi:hypothetical protein BpHYR1_029844 [Brachionus plicatilis]|uniref:Uncharacterized protein n=1 Tax=Brachionus plicatilis TaxID=10195 RepID=A0A3M7PZF5_BRAPC|nr:hypothetical protein BpHYR1_029844 [Brachionus plicatilis]